MNTNITKKKNQYHRYASNTFKTVPKDSNESNENSQNYTGQIPIFKSKTRTREKNKPRIRQIQLSLRNAAPIK